MTKEVILHKGCYIDVFFSNQFTVPTVSGFKFEVEHRRKIVAQSNVVFQTEDAALAAARQWVDCYAK
jgi:hypothetical protein